MSVKTSYKIIAQYRLIVQSLQGKIFLQDLVDLKNRLVKDVEFKQGYSMIVDIRNADLELSESDIDTYIGFLSAMQDKLKQGRSAILTNKPKQVALTTIFTERVEQLPASWGVFSTANAVLHWVNRPVLSEKDVNEVLQGLKVEITELS